MTESTVDEKSGQSPTAFDVQLLQRAKRSIKGRIVPMVYNKLPPITTRLNYDFRNDMELLHPMHCRNR